MKKMLFFFFFVWKNLQGDFRGSQMSKTPSFCFWLTYNAFPLCVCVCVCAKRRQIGGGDWCLVCVWRGEGLEDHCIFEVTGPWTRLVSLSFLELGRCVVKWKEHALWNQTCVQAPALWFTSWVTWAGCMASLALSFPVVGGDDNT